MEQVKLKAQKRERTGKGASRANRRAGLVPAVIYGDKSAPVAIALEEKVLVAQMGIKGIWTRQFSIDVDGKNYVTLCQDIQKHPVSDRPIHADFLHITKSSVLTMDIPLEFINEDKCPGIKLGGILNIVHRTIAIRCKADQIPTSFTIDLASANLGDSITSKVIPLPAGVTFVHAEEEDFTLATIVQPTQETAEEAPAAEAPAEAAAAPAAEKKADK